jgi:hypothetical protein
VVYATHLRVRTERSSMGQAVRGGEGMCEVRFRAWALDNVRARKS